MSRKLIALDMDGTFLTSQKEIPAANKQAVKKAQLAGHLVMICSGRPHDSLIPFLQEAQLGDLPISACNGSVTMVEGEIIHSVGMDFEVAKKAYDWLIEHDYPFTLYTNKGIFCPQKILNQAEKALEKVPMRADEHALNVAMLEEYLANNSATHFALWQELPAALQIYKFYIFTPDPTKKKAFEAFATLLSGLTVTSSYYDNVEISDANGHKGTGIIAVAKHFGINIADTVAIGDNFNDEGMLKIAGLAIAMGNAEDGIKELADVVTLTNDEFGVAHAIENYVL